ncbi:MAG: SDR family oxidoreductase [Bacteroidales bacterium]|nr:SDR family oxidoreductase [Saprospiraceae bacterium]MCF8381926.1 SDR family oxidoreductase [Bacteroidales bacterium]
MNILITGGASGLGKAISIILAKNAENTIYFTYSNSELNAKKIELDFKNAFSIRCDFRDPNSIKSLRDKISQLDIDVLINNAYLGNPINNYFHKISEDDFSSKFLINVMPTIQITQSAISYFRKKKKGKIITILTSFLLNTPPIGASGYVANKAYLASLVKSWANENSKFNITSNSVSPSFMQTNFTSEVDERIIEQMISDHPLKKLLTVEEVAETVFFLTNASSQINGVDIILNSGTNIK